MFTLKKIKLEKKVTECSGGHEQVLQVLLLEYITAGVDGFAVGHFSPILVHF
jgi:hypothetical protein